MTTAMRAGHKKYVRQQRRAAVKRVLSYRAWLREDLEHSRALRAHEQGIGEHPGSRSVMPCIPSDHDYTIAREEGIV